MVSKYFTVIGPIIKVKNTVSCVYVLMIFNFFMWFTNILKCNILPIKILMIFRKNTDNVSNLKFIYRSISSTNVKSVILNTNLQFLFPKENEYWVLYILFITIVFRNVCQSKNWNFGWEYKLSISRNNIY